MRRILSGIQPTNQLHIGNYLGALRNWVDLQKEDYDCLYCVVDLHAITVPHDPKMLLKNTREMVATYIAAGIDPVKNTIFAQSSVPAHAELGWILGCITPLGWLNRMTQFKEKAGKKRDQVSLGLYSYPVLMAADILLYKATHVPVGHDQKQHLELAREIAGSFNHRFKEEFFTLPEPQIFGAATRVMSLRDGTKKMSKSDISQYSMIKMTDDADTIAKKIRKAKTDADPLPETMIELADRPEALNLINIFAALERSNPDDVLSRYVGEGFAGFKKDLAELTVTELSPITAKTNELLEDTAAIDAILKEGAKRAKSIANPILKEVKQLMGFWS